jgi:hypothetical protein
MNKEEAMVSLGLDTSAIEEQRTYTTQQMKQMGEQWGSELAASFNASYIEKLKASKGATQSVLQSVMGSLGNIGSMFGLGGFGMGAAGAAAGLVMMEKSAIQDMDKLRNLSDVTGVGVQKLETYLTNAFTRGISQEKITTAFETLNEKLGEAESGSEAVQKLFDKWDIKTNDRSTSEVLDEIVEKMKGISSESEKAALAFDLMGRAGKSIGGQLPGLGQDSGGYGSALTQWTPEEVANENSTGRLLWKWLLGAGKGALVTGSRIWNIPAYLGGAAGKLSSRGVQEDELKAEGDQTARVKKQLAADEAAEDKKNEQAQTSLTGALDKEEDERNAKIVEHENKITQFKREQDALDQKMRDNDRQKIVDGEKIKENETRITELKAAAILTQQRETNALLKDDLRGIPSLEQSASSGFMQNIARNYGPLLGRFGRRASQAFVRQQYGMALDFERYNTSTGGDYQSWLTTSQGAGEKSYLKTLRDPLEAMGIQSPEMALQEIIQHSKRTADQIAHLTFENGQLKTKLDSD